MTDRNLELEITTHPREEMLMELEETISSGLFGIMITYPEHIEFKLKPKDEWVKVFYRWTYICSITQAQYLRFVDDESSLNKDFRTDDNNKADSL